MGTGERGCRSWERGSTSDVHDGNADDRDRTAMTKLGTGKGGIGEIVVGGDPRA